MYRDRRGNCRIHKPSRLNRVHRGSDCLLLGETTHSETTHSVQRDSRDVLHAWSVQNNEKRRYGVLSLAPVVVYLLSSLRISPSTPCLPVSAMSFLPVRASKKDEELRLPARLEAMLVDGSTPGQPFPAWRPAVWVLRRATMSASERARSSCIKFQRESVV